MKNIPVFTTENGAASLVLKEIPYYGAAYIKIQSTLEPEKLMEECVAFCKMAGAEQIFATGHSYLEQYPIHTRICRMSILKESLEQTDALLFPVTDETVVAWQELYNSRMADVANASYMDRSDCKKMIADGDGYFVHRDGVLLGIGKAAGNEIDAVVSAVPGMGETVVQALSSVITSETVNLTVTDGNNKAVRLYERMGFVKTEEISVWYRVN